jgi:nitric oxide reductase NorD protein
MSFLHLLEPEETIGNLWHRLVATGGALKHFPSAAVRFDEVERALPIFFRGLGGAAGVQLKPARPEVSHHRLDLRRRLGIAAERVGRARLDGDTLLLPEVLDVLPERAGNERLYFWLAAWNAIASALPPPARQRDPLKADLARVGFAIAATNAVLSAYPGLSRHHRALAATLLEIRPHRRLPAAEAMVEQLILDHLKAAAEGRADALPLGAIMDSAEAPHDYKPAMPLALWGEIVPRAGAAAEKRDDEEAGISKSGAGDSTTRKARRHKSDRIEKKHGLIVHRFEKILTWAEFMNLHRDVEDDDEDSAKKAADDHDEIGVTEMKRRAATRLKFDLDLSPADAEAERISDSHVYPEWDCRTNAYMPAAARVLERVGEEDESAWTPGPKTLRRIRAVRRQFEALRPRREMCPKQLDGSELDMDALIRARADLRASGEGSDRIYRQAREEARDLSVAVLVDVSRSTESDVGNRTVIDIEKEALVALAEGLAACGDPCAIYAFSSLKRTRVFMPKLKDFDEPAGPKVRARIGALKPAFYTRLGAAIRHTSAALSKRPSRKRLLIVLTDGKPNDLDRYDGRYGIEDSRMAVVEARRAGHAVFGITVDDKARAYFPRIFGSSAFAILSRPERLTSALPTLYRHLVQ